MKKSIYFFVAVILALSLILTVEFLPKYKEVASGVRNSLISGETPIKVGYFNPESVLSTLKNFISADAEIMYVSAYRYSWLSGNIDVEYSTVIEDQLEKVKMKVTEIALKIQEKALDDYSRILAVNDYIQENTIYDFEASKKAELSGYQLIPEDIANSVTAYGVLINNKGICQGYTAAASLLLNALGIDNRIQIGTLKGVPHSWLKVKIGEFYYNLDITNNDYKNPYAVFLSSDASLTDYTFTNNTPSGAIELYNYYRRNGKYVSSEAALTSMVKEEFLKGERSIAIKCAPKTLVDTEKVISSLRESLHFKSLEFGSTAQVYYFKFQ